MEQFTVDKLSVNELDDKAFENAYYNWLDYADYPWHKDNMESLNQFNLHFRVECSDFEYGGHSTPYIIYDIQNEIYRKDLQLCGDELKEFLLDKYSHLFEKRKYCLTGYYIDMALLDPFYNFIERENTNNYTLKLLIKEAMSSFIKACHDDYIDYYSKESFKDYARANEYFFTPKGYRFDTVF